MQPALVNSQEKSFWILTFLQALIALVTRHSYNLPYPRELYVSFALLLLFLLLLLLRLFLQFWLHVPQWPHILILEGKQPYHPPNFSQSGSQDGECLSGHPIFALSSIHSFVHPLEEVLTARICPLPCDVLVLVLEHVST